MTTPGTYILTEKADHSKINEIRRVSCTVAACASCIYSLQHRWHPTFLSTSAIEQIETDDQSKASVKD
jgi:hypothetical protein